MLSDPRLRKLVRESPITDHEVSAAYLFTNYARAEVTRRARMDQTANQKAAGRRLGKRQAPRVIVRPAAPGSLGNDVDVVGRLGNATELGAARVKQRDADALAQAQATAVLGRRAGVGRRARLLGGRALVRVRLDPQDHDHTVEAMANQASVATLTGQAPPGFNSERNALLLDISTRNAVKSAEALSAW